LSDLPTVPGELRAGSRVAGYTIEEQIGRGGMAVVYRASDSRLDRTVALKIMAPELASDTAFRQRFIREMRAAAAVDHPNIVPVFDAGEADGALFIAMRYVSGQDVRTLLDTEQRLTAPRAARLIAQAASALDEAHSHGLVHRDVKPGNMLVASGQPDHLYLSDFGLSKQDVSSAPITLTGQFLGTLDYMAPEQIEGHHVDGRADLYALACTAFEMLTGEPPFRRDQGVAVLWAQLQAPAPSLRAKRPDLPPAVDAVIARALAKSPDDRYPSCTVFAQALAAACGADGGQAGRADPGGVATPPGPPTEKARLPASAGAAGWQAQPQTPQSARPQPPDPETSWGGQPLYRPSASGRPAPQSPAQGHWPPPPPPTSGSPPRQPPAQGHWPAPPPPTSGSPPRQPPAQGHWPAPPPSTHHLPRGSTARRRRRTWPLAAACLLLLAAVGVGLALAHGRQPPTRPASGPGHTAKPASAAPPATAGPAATVRAYFAAINAHDYAKAWELGGKNTGSSYSAFVNGFNGTARDKVTVVSVAGDVATVELAATQTDGSVVSYQGTYTVTGGVITQSHIEQTG
jgi:serine/threonine protein kinase